MAKLVDMFGTECDYLYSMDKLIVCSDQTENGLALIQPSGSRITVGSRIIVDGCQPRYYLSAYAMLLVVRDGMCQYIFDMYKMEHAYDRELFHITARMTCSFHEISTDTFNMFMIKYG